MKRLAMALVVVAMASACKKADQPAQDQQMMSDSGQMDSTKMMGDSAHMMGDSTKMPADTAKQGM
jgi:hypothetical protein